MTTKKRFLYLFLIVSTLGFAQQENNAYQKMVEAERKSASQKINFRTNPNTLNYDVTYHKLEFTVDPTKQYISGVVTTNFTALSNMSTITFDMNPKLIVSKVTSNGNSLAFVQKTTNELVITFNTPLNANDTSSVVITYAGVPTSTNAFFSSFNLDTHGTNSPLIYTLSEPYGAMDWWPCKQDLNDKVDKIDVYITAPSTYVSVANGLEQSQTINGANKTTHFKHNYPIPAYLIAIAVSNYQIYNQQGGLGTTSSPYFPIVNYIYPESATSNISLLANTPKIINFYETKFGNYPFRNEKYGHAQASLGGGMEHTTVSFMGDFSFDLIAHEMAHQWFGDKITCGTWNNIWLNEGFAEYLTGLCHENFYGASNFQSWRNGKILTITSISNGAVYLKDSELTDVNRIFNSRLSYDKGAMVLHMLRFKMGDTNFFKALNNYLSDPLLAYGYATTPQFKAHIEAVAGEDYTEFFNDWIYNQGYPKYAIKVQNTDTGKVAITINQTQSDASVSFFEMPVPVRLLGANNKYQDLVLNNTFNGQVFTQDVTFPVTGVTFDYYKNIVSASNTAVLSNDAFTISDKIQLYPNPADDHLNVLLPENEQLEFIRVYNTLGQLLLQKQDVNFSINELSSGSYLLEIKTTLGSYHKRFIKK